MYSDTFRLCDLKFKKNELFLVRVIINLVLEAGLEPATYALRGHCSTN